MRPTKSDQKQAVQTAQKALQAAKNAEALARSNRSSEQRPSFISRHWKSIAAIVGPTFAVIGAWFTILPNVTIELGGMINPQQPFQTLFVVKNQGKLSAYNIRFGCAPKAAAMQVISMTAYTGSIARLAAGSQDTKTCLLETSSVTLPAQLTITATYELLPWIRVDHTTLAKFDVMRTAAGAFLLTPTTRDRGGTAMGGFELDIPGKNHHSPTL